MLPSFPSAPAWYRYVLTGRWLFLKAVVAAGRGPHGDTTGMSDAPSPLTGEPIAERLIAQGGNGYLIADALSRYVWTLRHLDGKRVVEIGCGTGYGAHVMSWVADSVVGLDFSEDALAHAREHYEGVDFRRFDLMGGAPLPAGDVATCFEVLEHLPDPEPTMRAMFATYERVFISVPNPWFHNSQLNPHHVNDFPLSDWRRRLRAAGAKRVSLSVQMPGRPEVLRGWRPRASSWVLDCSS